MREGEGEGRSEPVGDTDPRLLRLDPADNVLTVVRPVAAGETVRLGGRRVAVGQTLPLGHKAAARDIAAGAKVIKYGVPIGSATAPIAAGEHVHTHNLRSDYLPTYLHETQEAFFERGPEGGERPPGAPERGDANDPIHHS